MTAKHSQPARDCLLHNPVTLCRAFPTWPIKYGCPSLTVNTRLWDDCPLRNTPSPLTRFADEKNITVLAWLGPCAYGAPLRGRAEPSEDCGYGKHPRTCL